MQSPIVETRFNHRLYDLKVGGDIEVTGGIKAVVPDMQDFLAGMRTGGAVMAWQMINLRQDRIVNRLERLGDQR